MQLELDQKIKGIQESLRGSKPLVLDEYWGVRNSKAIDELREKYL